jgi:hypothetical protein
MQIGHISVSTYQPVFPFARCLVIVVEAGLMQVVMYNAKREETG